MVLGNATWDGLRKVLVVTSGRMLLTAEAKTLTKAVKQTVNPLLRVVQGVFGVTLEHEGVVAKCGCQIAMCLVWVWPDF
ncbi:hypothetical protein ACFWOJ_29800 [Streptomyces sp. NPDC058439]|uniref:hypothetical protein n=1 Tax=Streptomyces sp. NPDC058439 TaxID=3346500 RepID=UPI00364BABE6